MPRVRRILPPEAALHVICRGNNRQKIFHSDSDKLRYYALINELKGDSGINIYHYCFMDNHVHLLLRISPQSKLSKFMKQLNLTYFHYYRKLYGYFGHFWQDRFKSNIIEIDSYLLQCGKYIELNPVRANMISQPSNYPFSSYNFYASGKTDTIITPSPAYLDLANSTISRQRQYIDFVVNSCIINSAMLEKKIYIGSQAFINKLQEYYQVKNRRDARGRPPKVEK